MGHRTERSPDRRRRGLNPFEYVRTAGLPAIAYGYDVHGCADTTLLNATRAVTSAVMPPTAVKNPTLAMSVTTAICEDADPAMLAHTMPLKGWATAWWEQWARPDQMNYAFASAAERVGLTSKSCWQKVRGPASAVIA